jgi:ribulose-phosphate 3-epimerase
MVLIMSVWAGKGGQKFIPETLNKVKELKKYIEQNNLDIDIEIDGGINPETAKASVKAGVNILVAGTYILDHEDPKVAINTLKNIDF